MRVSLLNKLRAVFETGKIFSIAFILVVLIRLFVFQPFFVRGASMEPNFFNGEYLIIDEISYRFRDPIRAEVVVFRFPDNPSQYYIKRIIGLPGETVIVEDGAIFVQKGSSAPQKFEESYLVNIQTPGEIRTTLGPNEYFVLGDNRSFSSDSRRWGSLHRNLIVGRVALIAWPLEHLSVFAAPQSHLQ